MKGIVQRTGAAYKEQSGILSAATLDRASNAVTYRVYGCEQERKDAYEKNLSAYEKICGAGEYMERGISADLPCHLDGGCHFHFIFWK